MDNDGKMTFRERLYDRIVKRRKRLLAGKINCIPTPFKRFGEDFIGWEQAVFYLFTGSTKSGKSQFVSYLLYEAVMLKYHSFKRGEDLGFDVKVLWFPLEETKDKITLRFMAWLMNSMSGYKYRFSVRDMLSSQAGKPFPEEALRFINDPQFVEMVDFFESRVEFLPQKTASSIENAVKGYCETHGAVRLADVPSVDAGGKPCTVKAFERYLPDAPEEYVFAVVDTVNLVEPERGQSVKAAIDSLSQACIKLRNNYGVSPVLIQQQSAENEGLDSIKAGRSNPTLRGLGDSKYTSHDANVAISVFSPFKFKIREWLKYDITRLQDHFRAIEVLANRDGEIGGTIGLFFDGATCSWFELPKPDDTVGMSKVYSYIAGFRENETEGNAAV